MVSEVIPGCGRLLDPEEQSTVLQHVRYFSKNEQVLYVCHADAETRETEKRQLGRGWDSNPRNNKQVSIEDKTSVTQEKHISSQENKCPHERTKKNAKLVRFISRPHICNEEQWKLDFEEGDSVRPFPARPSTPKPQKSECGYAVEVSSLLPPLRRLKTIEYVSTQTVGVKNLTSGSTQASGSKTSNTLHTGQQNTPLIKQPLSNRTNDGKLVKSSSPGSSPKPAPKRPLAAPSSHPLSCNPPKTDTILRKVLTRGAFGGSLTSLASCESEECADRGRSVKKPEVAAIQGWASQANREHCMYDVRAQPSTRSRSLPRHITATPRYQPSDVSRELMTSPLSTLRLREAMESGLSCASTTVVRTLARRADLAAQYEKMSPEEHLDFIKRALAPRNEAGNHFRGRSSTIGGGERADVLLRNRPLGSMTGGGLSGSLDKLNVYSSFRFNKQKTMLQARLDG